MQHLMTQRYDTIKPLEVQVKNIASQGFNYIDGFQDSKK